MTLPFTRRLLPALIAAVALTSAGCSSESGSPGATSTSVSNPDQQDAGHRRLNQLVGDWTGEKSTYVAGGTPENPVRRAITSHWAWITKTGNNFLQETAENGSGEQTYFRQGVLGYSPTDDRYEWTTVDSVTPMTMSYKGEKDSGSSPSIVMLGEFTDPGIVGPQFVGKSIPMRTVITFESTDRTIMEISFMPPGESARVADRVVLTRKK